jgi:hypothetical protein
MAKMMQQLINPPTDWAARETFLVPARDLLQVFAQLNTHKLLEKAICNINMEHSLALEAAVKLAEPLETIVRKGIPLVKPPKEGPKPPPLVTAATDNTATPLTGTSSSTAANDPINPDVKPSLTIPKATRVRTPKGTNSTSGVDTVPPVGTISPGTSFEPDGVAPEGEVGSPLRERGDTMDSQSSQGSVSGLRGDRDLQLEHLGEEEHPGNPSPNPNLNPNISSN